jgi:hypothetical protein
MYVYIYMMLLGFTAATAGTPIPGFVLDKKICGLRLGLGLGLGLGTTIPGFEYFIQRI